MRPRPDGTDSFSGTAVVTRSGSVVTELAEGWADIEAAVPCTSETRFQLCSTSKQFAAVAVMLLVESGQLDRRDPIDRYLPQRPTPWPEVTLHQLLSHMAGFPHWREAPGLDPAQPMSIEQRLDVIRSTPLRTEPGAAWHYSSLGFLLSAVIVEEVSGQRYGEFVTERILSPLHLVHTTVGGIPDGAARGYRGGWPETPFDLDTMLGTGDVWSTAGDLSTFTTALHSGELVGTTSLAAMCTPYGRVEGFDDGEPHLTTTGYGYGMFIGTFEGHTARFHPGDNPGYQSLAAWIPDRAASIAILVNDETVDRTGLLRRLLPLALEP
jgi:CubicO group peptidase (beta-lactamase class C family)